MADAPNIPEKPEPLWRALMGNCTVAGYDFRKLSLKRPPDPAEPPVILSFPIQKTPAL